MVEILFRSRAKYTNYLVSIIYFYNMPSLHCWLLSFFIFVCYCFPREFMVYLLPVHHWWLLFSCVKKCKCYYRRKSNSWNLRKCSLHYFKKWLLKEILFWSEKLKLRENSSIATLDHNAKAFVSTTILYITLLNFAKLPGFIVFIVLWYYSLLFKFWSSCLILNLTNLKGQ